MKKNVALKIISSQYNERLEPSGDAYKRTLELDDRMEILTEGTVYTKDGATYITYEESSQAGLEDNRTLFRIKGDSLKIHRYPKNGSEDTEIALQAGVRNITRYKVPMVGSLDIETFCKSLNNGLDEEGMGTVSVDYKLIFDDAFSLRIVLDIEVKPE